VLGGRGSKRGPHVLSYDIATQGVSLHVPIHRVLGRLLVELRKEWGLPMLDLLPYDTRHKSADQVVSFVSALLEGPLRAQVILFPWILLLLPIHALLTRDVSCERDTGARSTGAE